ncbi:MAG: LPS export ABC transporter periplasmic protein LptC [Gemmatimonadota bacterium]
MTMGSKVIRDLWAGTIRVGAVGVGLLLLTVVGACGEEGDTPVVAEELARMDADNVVYGMTQVLTNEGIREGVVMADTAYFYRDSSAVHLRSLDMFIYDEDGNERARIGAERGRLEGDTRSMVARGDVVLRIPAENRRVETAELHYSSGQDRIWSDSATVMVDDGDVSCGTAFESDLGFRNLTIQEARTTGCDEIP